MRLPTDRLPSDKAGHRHTDKDKTGKHGTGKRVRGTRRPCPTSKPGRQDAERATAGAAPRRERAGTATRGAPPADIYAEVTDRIVAELEAGRLPWVQPWGNAGAPAPGLPRNALTGRPYSGINVLILWATVMARGWPGQSWLTFRQALAAGGHVRKGERGTTIVYADRFTPEAEQERAAAAGEEARAIPFLKRFSVFNVAQIDGLGADVAPEPQPRGERETVAVGEALIAASGVAFRIGGNEAFYAPGADIVQVPPQQAFFEQINYYRTAFHELTHATGHRSRLARDQSGAFGSAAYAREELVAELGSAFLCASLGIRPTVRHADYLASWLAVLRADSRAIFRAAAAASRAADWLLARLNAAAPDALAPSPRKAAA
jgi:antirestriction protein ArdC